MANFYATETNVMSGFDVQPQTTNRKSEKKLHPLNSAGKIKEKDGKEKDSLIVPILPLESILNEKNQKEDEHVINIVTGGSFGRINEHQQHQVSNS